MDKRDLFRTTYAAIKTAQRMYDEAGTDKELQENARMFYEMSTKKVGELGGVEKMLWRAYEEYREVGNDYIDFSDLTSGEYIAELVQAMKDYGISVFTFSSHWSSAVEVAWEFKNEGCVLEGLVEINTHHKPFMSDEYEKTHAYLFFVR